MVDGYAFYSCAECESLFIEPEVLVAMDCGESPREYDEHYWRTELAAARARSRGDGLVRAGEAILYARRQVRRFLDVAPARAICWMRWRRRSRIKPDCSMQSSYSRLKIAAVIPITSWAISPRWPGHSMPAYASKSSSISRRAC
jgi:hypothetical protein